MPLPCGSAVIIGQHHVIGRRRADRPLEASEVELIIAAAEHQRIESAAGLRDRLDIGDAPRRFDQPHDPDLALARGRRLGGPDHDFDGMHVTGRLAFRQQDIVQPWAGLDDVENVPAPPRRAQTVDADRDDAASPIQPIDRRNGLAPRLWLERVDNRILEVDEDRVGRCLRGLLEEPRRRGGNGEQRP